MLRRHKQQKVVVLLRGTGPRQCSKCPAVPPAGPLPWGWKVRREASDKYEKGYWLPLTCPKCGGV